MGDIEGSLEKLQSLRASSAVNPSVVIFRAVLVLVLAAFSILAVVTEIKRLV